MTMTSKPQLACEVAADRVLAARLSSPGAVDMCAASELAPGCVVPDMVEANLRDRSRILESIRQTLDGLSGRSRDVIAVLPDAASCHVCTFVEPTRAAETGRPPATP